LITPATLEASHVAHLLTRRQPHPTHVWDSRAVRASTESGAVKFASANGRSTGRPDKIELTSSVRLKATEATASSLQEKWFANVRREYPARLTTSSVTKPSKPRSRVRPAVSHVRPTEKAEKRAFQIERTSA